MSCDDVVRPSLHAGVDQQEVRLPHGSELGGGETTTWLQRFVGAVDSSWAEATGGMGGMAGMAGMGVALASPSDAIILPRFDCAGNSKEGAIGPQQARAESVREADAGRAVV